MQALQRAQLRRKYASLAYLTPNNVKQRCLSGWLRRADAGVARSSRLAALPQQLKYPPQRARHKRQRLNPVPYRPASRLDSDLSVKQYPDSSTSRLQDLQNFLGYHFKSEQLLAQACTHSADKQALSYRQLAFVGDATLWMMFSEYAFHTFGAAEDPVSGAWPAHMSSLLSRANCAATARQWGLQHYLQHSSNESSDSSSSSRSTGMYNGSWSSDTLAEMFEGVIGALLFDSDYATVRQLLQPWVAAAFDGSRAAAAAAAAVQVAGQQATEAVQLDLQVNSSSSSTNAIWLQQQQLAMLLHRQLQLLCGYSFANKSIIHACSGHVLQLLLHGKSDTQAGKWRFLGFSLLQFAAAQHAYKQQCQQATMQASFLQQQQQQGSWPWWQQHYILGQPTLTDLRTNMGSNPRNSSSGRSSSSASGGDDDSSSNSSHQEFRAALDVVSGSSSSSDDTACSSSSSKGSSNSSNANQVQLMSKEMERLTAIRHRCKMWLQLGLDPAAFCPADSYVLASKWKVQKGVLSRCLNVLLAAVFLDGGMAAVMHVLDTLLSVTPPTGLDKSWLPAWAQRHGEMRGQQQQQQPML